MLIETIKIKAIRMEDDDIKVTTTSPHIRITLSKKELRNANSIEDLQRLIIGYKNRFLILNKQIINKELVPILESEELNQLRLYSLHHNPYIKYNDAIIDFIKENIQEIEIERKRNRILEFIGKN